jgi:flagellar motility protein MotE (MotC chaperone)
MKPRKFKEISFFWILAVLFLSPAGVATGQETAETSKKAEEPSPKSELDNLKAEWEAVREQQVQMIREKEDQLEKLKEEIFSEMKALNAPVALQQDVSQPKVPGMPGPVLPVNKGGAGTLGSGPEVEAQRAALQAERQKFFAEMNRQKESLRQLQATLDEKAKQLEAERNRFEQEKKTAVR